MSEWIELLEKIPNIGQMIATFVVIIMSWMIRRIIHKLMHTYIEDVHRYHKYKRVTTYLLFCISALLLIVVCLLMSCHYLLFRSCISWYCHCFEGPVNKYSGLDFYYIKKALCSWRPNSNWRIAGGCY